MFCYQTLPLQTNKQKNFACWCLHRAISLGRELQNILLLSKNIRHHWCTSKATEALKAPATSPQNMDKRSQTYVCFLKSENVKYKKEAPINPKWATYQFLCIFSLIISPDIYYFLLFQYRKSHHCLTSLDRIDEENQVIGRRPQGPKKSGWKITQRIKREITSSRTSHLFFL